MLSNLNAELIRKKYNPVKAIANVLDCTERTAKNKLHGITAITVPEAVKIMNYYFSQDRFKIEYLFAINETDETA